MAVVAVEKTLAVAVATVVEEVAVVVTGEEAADKAQGLYLPGQYRSNSLALKPRPQNVFLSLGLATTGW